MSETGNEPGGSDNDSLSGTIKVKLAIALITPDEAFKGGAVLRSNNVDAGREIAEHLYELGHRRIAYLGGPEDSLDSRQRAQGLEEGLAMRRLKIAGEIQPSFRDYWEAEVEPHVDGRQIEFVGEADHEAKNELLGHAAALLFPIEWEEPFGLVMIEAMACGTPVLALRRGSVPEIVEDGVNGWIGETVDDLVARAADLRVTPAACRESVERRFSVEAMGRRYEALYARLTESSLTAAGDSAR